MIRVLGLLDRRTEYVMVGRYDVTWFTPLRLDGLDAHSLWLPHYCMPRLHARAAAPIEKACGSDRGALAEPPYGARLVPDRRYARQVDRSADYNTFVLDYWFVASVEVALTFGAIYHEHSGYTRQLSTGLGTSPPNWMHFFWAHHISTLLRRSARPPALKRVRFVAQHEVAFNLARHWRGGADCLVNLPDDSFRSLRDSQAVLNQKLTPNPYQGHEFAIAPGRGSG